jgi:glycosyltransferase involved in cell wall biosynthesis
MAHQRPVHVAYVVDALALGGAERAAVHFARLSAAAGNEPVVIATRAGGPLAAEVDPGIEVEVLHKRGAVDVQAWRKLAALLEARDIDVVHANGTAVIAAAAAARLRPTALVWHYHSNRLPPPAVRAGLRLALTQVDAVAAADPQAARSLVQRLGGRVPVQPLLNPLAFDPQPHEDAPDGTVRIISVANLRAPKDPVTLVRAVGALAAEGLAVRLDLVGATSEHALAAEVRAEVDRHGLASVVQLVGPATDIADRLARSDVGVLSSRSEALPMVLLEYGASRLATVAPEVGRIPWLLEGGHAGLLFQPGDADGLADALRQCATDRVARDRLAGRLQERVAQLTDPARLSSDLEQLHAVARQHRSGVASGPRRLVARR